MAPLKFEDNIKEKLEQRAIQPSGGSWEKLERELDHKEEQKKYKRYWMIGVAAGLVGFLMVTTVITGTDGMITKEQVDFVESTKKNKIEEKSEDFLEETKNIPSTLVQNSEEEKEKKPVIKNNINIQNAIVVDKKLKASKMIDSINISKSIESIVSNTAIAEDTKLTKKTIDSSLPVNKTIIDTKLAGVVDKIKELREDDVLVTEQEIDKLLRNAQQEIAIQQILKSNTVDASSLLLDVESELDETFKQRVFEALKTGFQKLKTSVVERDN